MYRCLLFSLLFLMAPAFGESATPFEELYRSAIEGTDDLETVVGVIHRDGASRSARHYHPKGEYGVILEGEVTIESEGDAKVTLVKGDTFYQPPGKWHIISTGKAPSRTVVFRVVEKHKSMVVPAP